MRSRADPKLLRSSCFSLTVRGVGAGALCPSERWPQELEEAVDSPHLLLPTQGTGAEHRATGVTGACRGASAPPAATSPGGAARVGLRARLRQATITTRHQLYRQAALAQGRRGRQIQGKVCGRSMIGPFHVCVFGFLSYSKVV